MENEKIKNVMLWLNIIKGYADYISDDDITIAINTKGILVAVSNNSGDAIYIPINTNTQDVDIVSEIVNEFKK